MFSTYLKTDQRQNILKMQSPIFIFSLPRSGSTLLQKMLASHSEINTTNEPWVLLPLLYPLKNKDEKGMLEYHYEYYQQAIKVFIDQLPDKKDDYCRGVNCFVSSLYEKVGSKDCLYFLDKTPRYYLIIPEITRTFPDAKFIFLFRNPLAVLSSICNTWHGGTFELDDYNKMDLNVGPAKLCEGYGLIKDKAIEVRYESLVKNPEREIEKVCRYLDVEFEGEMVKSFANIPLSGNLGDPKINDHDAVHTDSVSAWKHFFNSPLRIKAAKKYLDSIPEQTLKTMGYGRDALLQELQFEKHYLWNIGGDFYAILKALWKTVSR